MKIPQIILTPPAWLALPMACALGLLWLASMIILKNLIH
jgi:hypothetical protein